MSSNSTTNSIDDFQGCTAISPECPVEGTAYSYYPNLGANAFFTAIFALLLSIQLFQGCKWKTRSYMIALGLGCLGETIGSAGRVIMNDNPWSQVGFNMQICCLIIAPAFISAGIYLTLKHIVLTIGEEYSSLQARWYTWIFILCDLFSLILQGAGGGIAATADEENMQKVGNNLMMAGIVFQVFTLLVLYVLVVMYARTANANRNNFSQSTVTLLSSTRFRLFITSLITAWATIFARCVYRIAEMAGGWGNPVMQDEVDFIVLENVMILIATLCLTIFHPGYCFPQMQMANKHASNEAMAETKNADTESA